jgi:16S rRNA (cytosine967-C5)-methyltransferase
MTAREAAFRALTAHMRTGVWTDAVLDGILRRENLSDRESALASRLFYGVVQNLALLDHYIAAFSSVGLSKLQPQVRSILRLGVYQLFFLSKIPVNAAVSESVELAKRFANPRAASFTNAVLRKLSANSQRLPPVAAETECTRLSIQYSHPEWLVRAFTGRLGAEGAEALLKADNEPAVLTAMVNTLKSDATAVIRSLSESGAAAAAHPWLPGCLEIKNAHRPDRLEAFREGWLYIQDPAAALAVMAADAGPGMFVVDGCAAPGGKSFGAAVGMKDSGHILACDVREKKTALISEGAGGSACSVSSRASWTRASQTKRCSGGPTPSWPTCRVRAWASYGKNRRSGIRNRRSSRGCRSSSFGSCKIYQTMSDRAACWSIRRARF